MHNTPDKSPIIDWVRRHFGIEDEDELRAVLGDPGEVLALLDVADEVRHEAIPDVKSSAGHIV